MALGDLCLKDPGLRTGGAGTRHSRVLRLRCTRALAPGLGTTLGKPGVLLSPELLLEPEGAAAVVDSAVSVRLRENLRRTRNSFNKCIGWNLVQNVIHKKIENNPTQICLNVQTSVINPSISQTTFVKNYTECFFCLSEKNPIYIFYCFSFRCTDNVFMD